MRPFWVCCATRATNATLCISMSDREDVCGGTEMRPVTLAGFIDAAELRDRNLDGTLPRARRENAQMRMVDAVGVVCVVKPREGDRSTQRTCATSYDGVAGASRELRQRECPRSATLMREREQGKDRVDSNMPCRSIHGAVPAWPLLFERSLLSLLSKAAR